MRGRGLWAVLLLCAAAAPAWAQTATLSDEDYARAVLYGPFNFEARSAAGFDEEELRMLEAFVEG